MTGDEGHPGPFIRFLIDLTRRRIIRAVRRDRVREEYDLVPLFPHEVGKAYRVGYPGQPDQAELDHEIIRLFNIPGTAGQGHDMLRMQQRFQGLRQNDALLPGSSVILVPLKVQIKAAGQHRENDRGKENEPAFAGPGRESRFLFALDFLLIV
ncbi:hypothetical protein SDC9_132578 [bioreactor metagenome]|uniref:Uncharacterized protein n=1 Tax=bioreactor metagenome TaxID=1076179 RepID=A0A645D8H4_9ZZZZ